MERTAKATLAGAGTLPQLTPPAGHKYEILDVAFSTVGLAGFVPYAQLFETAWTTMWSGRASIAGDFGVFQALNPWVVYHGEAFRIGALTPGGAFSGWITYIDVVL